VLEHLSTEAIESRMADRVNRRTAVEAVRPTARSTTSRAFKDTRTAQT
jgi:hypothetical protein